MLREVCSFGAASDAICQLAADWGGASHATRAVGNAGCVIHESVRGDLQQPSCLRHIPGVLTLPFANHPGGTTMKQALTAALLLALATSPALAADTDTVA